MGRFKVVLLLLGLGSFFMHLNFASALNSSIPQYTLGFLTPAAASEIPTSLAIEWESAFRVAVEVENSKLGRAYKLVPHSEYSDCDWQTAYHGALAIATLDNNTYPPVIGVVGPACSGAAMSSVQPLKPLNISMVSFAATAEPITVDRAWFFNLFRTVYNDKFQAQAVAASITKLNMTSATLIHTNQYYSANLAQDINETINHGQVNLEVVMLASGTNSSIDSDQLKTVLDNHTPTDFVILVLHPQEAHDVFEAVNAQGRLEFPWWYFGTDGVTALDPSDENQTDPTLVSKLLGEIGLSPYGGDYSNNSICDTYFTYWKTANYPGLPVSGLNKSRSYTPYLIDTVRLYFEAVDSVVSLNLPITAGNVLQALNGSSAAGILQFDGCTGVVAIDPVTGSRDAALQPPIYDLVSFTSDSWEAKGRIQSDNFVTLQPLQRPNSQFAPNSAYNGPNPNKSKTGAIVGGVFGVLAAAGVGVGAYFLYKQKRRGRYNPTSFVRVMD